MFQIDTCTTSQPTSEQARFLILRELRSKLFNTQGGAREANARRKEKTIVNVEQDDWQPYAAPCLLRVLAPRHAALIFVERKACRTWYMHYDHNTCMYQNRNAYMYYDIRTYIYSDRRTCM